MTEQKQVNHQKPGGSPRQRTERIGETEYTFQKLSAREWVRLRDRCKNRDGVMMEETFMSEVLKYIVVSPKVALDDFYDWELAQEVVNSAVTFQLGKSAAE